MSRYFSRTHTLPELSSKRAQPAYRKCVDCGGRCGASAKRCNICAYDHNMKRRRDGQAAKRKRTTTLKETGYQDMLRVLGVREDQGDCL